MEHQISHIPDGNGPGQNPALSFYFDKGNYTRQLVRLFICTAAGALFTYFTVALIFGLPRSMITLTALFIGFGIGFLGRKKAAEKLVKPILEISREGISIHSLNMDSDIIPWEEIKDIRAYIHPSNWPLRTPMIGITPYSMKQTAGHFRNKSFGAEQITRFYKLFGITVAPINIDGTLLTPSAYEVVAEINNVREEVHMLKAFDDQQPKLHLTE